MPFYFNLRLQAEINRKPVLNDPVLVGSRRKMNVGQVNLHDCNPVCMAKML